MMAPRRHRSALTALSLLARGVWADRGRTTGHAGREAALAGDRRASGGAGAARGAFDTGRARRLLCR